MLFQTIKTMVAIFLAKVSRAISGRMPLVRNAHLCTRRRQSPSYRERSIGYPCSLTMDQQWQRIRQIL